MSENAYISYKDFKVENLSGNSVETKNIPNQTGTYNVIPLSYKYPNNITTDLYMEFPMCRSRGVVKKVEENKNTGKTRVTYSCMVKFSISDKEHIECIEKIKELHKGAAKIVAQHKGRLGMYDFDPERPGGLFKNPVYFPRDKATGNIIKGRDPSMWLKMITIQTEKTLFTKPFMNAKGDIVGEPIDWELLENVEMKFIPLIKFEKIYNGGGKASLQCKLASAIVLEVHKAGTITRQLKTISSLLKNNPSMISTIEDQLSQLQMDKQDELLSNSDEKSKEMPNGTSENKQVDSSLNDFLSGAPNLNNPRNSPNTYNNIPQLPKPGSENISLNIN